MFLQVVLLKNENNYEEKALMKFAYLIIVHTRFDQVAKLLELLDDEKNDLYVHIDEKVANSFDIFQRTLKPSVQKSKIYLVNPHNVTWGGKSQIEAELELLKAAIKGDYDYYHLISGMDLPIKTQKEIHEFFENNKGKEFIHFGTNEDARKRCQYYWFYQEKLGNVAKAGILKKICNKLRLLSIFVQKLMGIDRVKKYGIYENVAIGSNWFSITDSLARYVVSKEQDILKCYKDTYCCDEVFLQTLVYNSSYKNNLYSYIIDDYHANMRDIDWKRGRPYTWRNTDFDELMASDYLFARKFDEQIDDQIVYKIYMRLKSK